MSRPIKYLYAHGYKTVTVNGSDRQVNLMHYVVQPFPNWVRLVYVRSNSVTFFCSLIQYQSFANIAFFLYEILCNRPCL
jgi:hypothetical protein